MFGILLLFVLVLLFVLGAMLEWKKWTVNKRLKSFHAGYNFPILGYAGKFIGKSETEAFKLINHGFRSAPKMPFRIWFGPKLVVGISDPEDIKTVLNSGDCLDKPYIYKQLHINLSLVASPKEIWKRDRRALNPSFSNGIMTRFLPVFNEKAKNFCDHLEQSFEESDGNDQFKDLLVGCMANQVINTSFHPDCELSLSEALKLNRLLLAVGYYLKERNVRPWLKWDFVYRLTKAYKEGSVVMAEYDDLLQNITTKLCNIMADQIEHGEDVPEVGKPNKMYTMIEKCIELKREGIFTDENIDDQIRFLFAASVDTTSTAITNTLLLLAIHPEYQERVVEELNSIFESIDSPVTFADLSKAKLLDMVLKETLRYYAIVSTFGRECSVDLPTKNGTIPKNTMVLLCTEQIHHDKKTWGDNADEFYPERFLPANMANVHPYSYVPFGAGPRNCIGMKYAMINIKVYLAHLLRRYKFTTDLTLQDVRFSCHFIMYVTNERPFQFERRKF